MAALPIKDIAIAVRYFCDYLEHAVDNQLKIAQGTKAKHRRKVVGSVVKGTSIVMIISLLERIILDLVRTEKSGAVEVTIGQIAKWRKILELDPAWSGWSDLEMFIKVRHCYAHEYGRVTKRQRAYLVANKGTIYDIDTKDHIVLNVHALDLLRARTAEFLNMLQGKGYM